MNESYRSIYQIARKNAGFTQLEAAELLHISVRTLGSYELGDVIPNGDLVYNMVTLYDAKWLGYEHLRQSTKVGKKMFT